MDDVQGLFGSVGSAGSRVKGLLPTGALASLSSSLRSTAGSAGASAPQYSDPSTAERDDEGESVQTSDSAPEANSEGTDMQRGGKANSGEAGSRSEFVAENA